MNAGIDSACKQTLDRSGNNSTTPLSRHSDCIHDRLGSERKCPTCKLPAIVKNLRPDPMHDTLVACVQKLKIKVAPPISSFEYPSFSGLTGGGNSMISAAAAAVAAGVDSTVEAVLSSQMACQNSDASAADIKRSSRNTDHAVNTHHGDSAIDNPPPSHARDQHQPIKEISLCAHQHTLSSLDMDDSDAIHELLCNEDLPDDERPPLPPRPCDTVHKPLPSYSSIDTIMDLDALFKESELPDDEKTHSNSGHPQAEHTGKPTVASLHSEPSSKRLRTTTPHSSSFVYPGRLLSCQDGQPQPVTGTSVSDRTACRSHEENPMDAAAAATAVILEREAVHEQIIPSTFETQAGLATISSATEKGLSSFSLHQSQDLPTLQQERTTACLGSSATPLIRCMFTGVSDVRFPFPPSNSHCNTLGELWTSFSLFFQ
ncbi:hypothetical protein BX666DRAFT_1032313 [Dichotomocladium elegans]|nr:hypothetical protein BX666DRAFT_1032313 [Dichotomocladium elegans]